MAIILKEIVLRLFNSRTKKSFSHLVVGGCLMYMGFSEDFIDKALVYDWQIFNIINEYRYLVIIIGLLFLMIGGFYLFALEYSKFEVKKVTTEQEISKKRADIAEFRLREMVANKERERIKAEGK